MILDSGWSRAGRPITDLDAKDITRVEELAYDLKISEVMTRNFKFITPDMNMGQVLDLFQSAHISGAPVVEGDRLLGIISIEDLIRGLRENGLSRPVTDYMTAQVVTVNSFEPLVEALKAFAETSLGRFPVLDHDHRLVGVITKGDITRGVLRAIEVDYQAEEVRRYRASHLFEDIVSDRTSLVLRYWVPPRDFARGGQASSHIKRALLRLGASPKIARRCGIAVYEAEMNLVIHTTNGGVIWAEIQPKEIFIQVTDDGPGIKDVELARKPGYSTAPESVREMGFGAGMGLENIRRCVDDMSLESAWGKGTTLEIKIVLQPQDSLGEVGVARQGEST